MLMLATIVLAAVSSCCAQQPVALAMQEPTAAAQQTPPAPVQQVPPAPANGVAEAQMASPPQQEAQFVTLPAGTRIPLTLANPIKPKAARRGDSVHAVTAFPVTVNDQVAIPAGVLVEGVIEKLVKKDRFGHPWVEVHFTRMVFPNGYVLPLEAESTEAHNQGLPNDEAPASAPVSDATDENGPSAGDAFEFQFQQPPPPTLPPLPKPNYGPAIGLSVAGVAGMVAIAILATHHRYDEFWYGVGYQFDMLLQAPVQVDAASWNAGSGN